MKKTVVFSFVFTWMSTCLFFYNVHSFKYPCSYYAKKIKELPPLFPISQTRRLEKIQHLFDGLDKNKCVFVYIALLKELAKEYAFIRQESCRAYGCYEEIESQFLKLGDKEKAESAKNKKDTYNKEHGCHKLMPEFRRCQVCFPKAKKPCYTGPYLTKGIGLCREGVRSCTSKGEWDSSCIGETLPQEEKCNGKDDDCDGKIDEVWKNKGKFCWEGMGKCRVQGKLSCTKDGKGLFCAIPKKVVPDKEEICNGIDDTCNGFIDQKDPSFRHLLCSKQEGVCAGSKQTCAGKKGWIACSKDTYKQHHPEYEEKETLCDGKDNDCNGLIDDGLQAPLCEKQQGVCSGSRKKCGGIKGWLSCDAGNYGKVNEYEEKETLCDGKDNDCDGMVDNIRDTENPLIKTCYTGLDSTRKKGVCEDGVSFCMNGTWTSQCYAQRLPQKERCNGLDDDCDGKIDEDWPAKLKPCHRGIGECFRSGVYICDQKGTGLTCSAEAGKPKNKILNGKDNDCDGEIDGVECTPGDMRDCFSSQVGCKQEKESRKYQCFEPCRVGRQYCLKNFIWGKCEGEILPRKEQCNGKDDDCDGLVDNNIQSVLCSNQHGVCAGSQKQCNGNLGWQDCRENDYKKHHRSYEAEEVTCDGKDNDCDGLIDNKERGKNEPLEKSCYSGKKVNEKIRGECKEGKRLCINGKWGRCHGEVLPKKEECNGKDDDCDGLVDNIDQNPLERDCFPSEKGCRLDSHGKWNCTAPCQAGKEICNGGKWSRCYGAVLPTSEVCNGRDDDCDGKIDNAIGCPHHHTLTGCFWRGTRFVTSAKESCRGWWITDFVSIKDYTAWCGKSKEQCVLTKQHQGFDCSVVRNQKNPLKPIDCFTPLQAEAYCHALGLRLPQKVDLEKLEKFDEHYALLKNNGVYDVFDIQTREKKSQRIGAKQPLLRAYFFCTRPLK